MLCRITSAFFHVASKSSDDKVLMPEFSGEMERDLVLALPGNTLEQESSPSCVYVDSCMYDGWI